MQSANSDRASHVTDAEKTSQSAASVPGRTSQSARRASKLLPNLWQACLADSGPNLEQPVIPAAVANNIPAITANRTLALGMACPPNGTDTDNRQRLSVTTAQSVFWSRHSSRARGPLCTSLAHVGRHSGSRFSSRTGDSRYASVTWHGTVSNITVCPKRIYRNRVAAFSVDQHGGARVRRAWPCHPSSTRIRNPLQTGGGPPGRMQQAGTLPRPRRPSYLPGVRRFRQVARPPGIRVRGPGPSVIRYVPPACRGSCGNLACRTSVSPTARVSAVQKKNPVAARTLCVFGD